MNRLSDGEATPDYQGQTVSVRAAMKPDVIRNIDMMKPCVTLAGVITDLKGPAADIHLAQ